MGLFNKKEVAPLVEVATPDTELRSYEIPIYGSPYQPLNVTTLEGIVNTGLVSPDRALTLTIVNRCVEILATDVAQLPLVVNSNGTVIPQSSSSVVVRPNDEQSLYAFLEEVVNSLAIHGNAYWLNDRESPVTTISKNPVKNLYVLNPTETSIEYDQDGNKFYRSGQHRYPSWRVTHLKHTRYPGYQYGVGPIQKNQNELRGALDLRNYADNWFAEGKLPMGVLKSSKAMNEAQADAAYKRLTDFLTGESSILVLGDGWDYVPITLNPADAQFLENQQATSAKLAQAFGVPGIKVGIPTGDSSTYTNNQEVNLSYVQDTLMKYIKEIESAFSDLFPRGQDVVFNLDGLLRADVYTQGGAAPDGTGNPNSNESSENA